MFQGPRIRGRQGSGGRRQARSSSPTAFTLTTTAHARFIATTPTIDQPPIIHLLTYPIRRPRHLRCGSDAPNPPSPGFPQCQQTTLILAPPFLPTTTTTTPVVIPSQIRPPPTHRRPPRHPATLAHPAADMPRAEHAAGGMVGAAVRADVFTGVVVGGGRAEGMGLGD